MIFHRSFALIPLFFFGKILAQSPVRDTALIALTRSAFTPLYYGAGTDRLGGARLETLDSGVVLRVTGYTPTLWRVHLAPNRTAYVPIEQVTADTLPRPASGLTGTGRVWGDERFDYVSIALPARLPYASRYETSPNRLVVDVFGATSNTNWIMQLRSAQEIREVSYEQVSDDVFRLKISLRHPLPWGHSVFYQKQALVIRVRRPPARLRLRGLTVAVDAGHGGSNTGARGGQSGRLEKEFTLDVAQRLRRSLERAGARVILTRNADTALSPTERLRAMRQALPDLLLSVHFNASANRAVRGVSTYYRHEGFRPLSVAVLRELLRMPVAEFGNVGAFNFFFNAPTDYPNVLVEGPFLSNETDEALILDQAFRQRMAERICRGVRRFLKEARRGKHGSRWAERSVARSKRQAKVATPRTSTVRRPLRPA
ncbi:MAG: N-acetylmuramoyl-L-alanine amidase [Sphingobacteriaceae bacterium]|nr:N-acetylmuramoyl-L-alanine amidase [Cytophagaceae bacterium]